MSTDRDRDWTSQAACRNENPELFFPFNAKDPRIPAALAVCIHCTVRTQCREYADATNSRYGIWGGKLRNTTAGQGGISSAVRIPSRRHG